MAASHASDALRDKDGFIGHEFYVESADGHSMERVTTGLVPVVSLPSIHVTLRCFVKSQCLAGSS